MKLNASKCYQESNGALLLILEAKGWTIDRFGHARKTIRNEEFRYKFLANTVRFEIQTNHEASNYAPSSKSWVRIKTLKYKKVS